MTRLNARKPGPTARARKAKAAKRLRDYKKAIQTMGLEEEVDGRLLGYCKRCGVLAYVQIHHKRPRSLAPELRTAPSNLEPICPSCHRKAHAAGRRGD